MGIQVFGATAGIAGVVYLIGAAIMWVRLHSLGFPAERVVSVIPRETILAVGILNVLIWGGAVLVLLGAALITYYVAWPRALDHLVKRTRRETTLGKFVNKLEQSRRVLRFDPPSPGEPPREVRLPGPEIPATLIGAIMAVSAVAFLIAANLSSSWQLLVASLIGLPVVILLLTENRRRVSEFGHVSEDEPTAEDLKELEQASTAFRTADAEVERLEKKISGLRADLVSTDPDLELVARGLREQIEQDTTALEDARKETSENQDHHIAYLAWDKMRALRDVTSGRPRIGLRFVQVLAVTIYGGLFGLAYVADRSLVPVESADLAIAVEGANGRLDVSEMSGILVAQTPEGVHLGIGDELVFVPASSVRELHTDAAELERDPPSGSIADQAGVQTRLKVIVVVVTAALLIGWVLGRRRRESPVPVRSPTA